MHAHRVDVEREHVLLGQAGEERRRRRSSPRRSSSASRRSAATAFASPRSIAAAAFTKRSRTSAAFDGFHAAGPVARGVADRQEVEQPQALGVARARGGDVVGDRRVGEIAPGRDLGHEEVVAHEPRHDLAGLAVETHAPHDPFGRVLRRPRSGRRACPWRCRATARRATTARAGGTRARRPRRRRPPGRARTARRPRRAGARDCATASSRCRSTV